ncbi:MAG: diacylglycerol kinase [Marinilabiliales bacterium]|nr:MAG: diacylglycerol kinase [Marinilabiliales bacterium]
MKKQLRSFKYALEGIVLILKSQPNMWIHIAVAVLTLISSIYFRITTTEWLFVIVAIGSVIASEAFNTSIEKLTDLVSPQKNELAKATKDTAAAAVLLSSIFAVIIGILIFGPYLLELLNI